MLEFALWAVGLLAPVAALAFAALRRRRRLVYPHGLLPSAWSARRSGPLFRRLKAGYDTALDAAAALAAAAYLALASAGTGTPAAAADAAASAEFAAGKEFAAAGEGGAHEPAAAADAGRVAMVIDCSASMRWGRPGARPIDAAAREAFEASRSGSPPALYLLGAERGSGRASLRRADALVERASSPEELAAMIESAEPFYGVDYELIADRRLRNYDSLVLICDEFGPEASGFSVMELGWREPVALVPVAMRPTGGPRDRGWGLASFIALGGVEPESLSAMGEDGAWRRTPPEAWRIEPGDEAIRVALRDPGRYRLGWDGGATEFELPGLEAPARPRPRAGSAAAAAAEAAAVPSPAERAWRVVASVIEGSEAGAAAEPRAAAIAEGGGRGRRDALSLAGAAVGQDGLVIDPGLARGALVATAWRAEADLSLGDAALADGDAALAVWTAWEERALSAAEPPASRLRLAAGAPDGEFIELAAIPLDEWFRPAPGGAVDRFGRTGGDAAGAALRLGLLAALAAAYLVKLAIRARARSATRPEG